MGGKFGFKVENVLLNAVQEFIRKLNAVMWFKGDNRPVERVSWNAVQEFIRKLNEKEGTDKYRLPSEAEWEYACRAGTTTRYSFGDDGSKLGDYAWYFKNVGIKTHSVGQKKPNPWGLYDMHGNVREWVQDKWHGSYDGAPNDGSAWESGDGANRSGNWFTKLQFASSFLFGLGGTPRVIRGGSWINFAGGCRSSNRSIVGAGARGNDLGFRLLKEL